MVSARVVDFPDGMTGKVRGRSPLVRSSNKTTFDVHESTNIREDVQDIRSEIAQIKEAIEASLQTASSQNGGGDIMEKILEKVNEIDKKVAVIEERTKKLDNLATKDEIKTLISEAITNSGMATKEHVELKIVSSRNAIILWTIGTVIAATGILIKFL
ncbi:MULTISPECIES: hypothetical protein [Bacillus]|uniref:hypothetical protein n=1 Tax=Bacillus TaxID=1386 RepID=UPI00061DE07B|nr:MULTISPECIES: hypothetical protein [Bacillus]AKE24346.1 hypothetical protein BsLM_2548 [Bacillus sp. LM 4-2]MBC9025567.1 hypothetical protein [Bacillus subtilis]MBT1087450.1 hypothetical protein [Bacillus subtilis]MBT2224222.1 hypothetical protein [Bacillus subtilis]MCA4141637.1 hypothetical protein [Bacillus subtilis]